MNTTFNPYRRMTIVIVVIFLFFAAVSIACNDTDFSCPDGPAACVVAESPLTAPSGDSVIDQGWNAVSNLCETAGYHKDASGNCVP